jgi:hypothetical protein
MSLDSFCDLAHNAFVRKLECEQSRLGFQWPRWLLQATSGASKIRDLPRPVLDTFAGKHRTGLSFVIAPRIGKLKR